MKFPLKPFVIFLAAAPFSAIAQEVVLDAIVVTGQKIDVQSFSGTDVDAASLASQRPVSSDTASLLQDVPGISLYGAGGISSLPAIHGMADDRVRIQVDGMGLVSACPNHMNSPLSYIDPTNVDIIKVYTGITPVSAGGDSIGGTIQVNSAAPEFARSGEGTLLKGQLGAFYRSNGDGYGTNLSTTLANEYLNLTYNGSTAQSNNYRAAQDFKAAGPAAADRGWLAGNEVGSSAYKSENHELGLALRHENNLLEFKASMQDVPYELFPNQRMDMTENNNKQFSLRYTGQFQWGDLETRIYEQTTRHKMQFGEDKQLQYGTALGMPMESSGKNRGALIQGNILLSARDTIKLGSEIQNFRLNDWWPASMDTVGGMGPGTFQNINNGQRDRAAFFAEWDASWSPQWFSQLGLRSEMVKMNAGAIQGYNDRPMYADDAAAFNALDHQRTDHNLDLTALARYTASPTQTLELGYAQKTRSPNLYERYTWSAMTMAAVMNNFAGDGNGYVGNINLKPEVAHTVSATWDWHDADKEQWNLKVTPYYTYVTDYVDAQRCPLSFSSNCTVANQTATTGFVNLQYVNQTAQLYGMDVSSQMNLGEYAGYGSFVVNGVLNYTRGSNLTTGDNLYNIMPLNTKLAVVQSVGNWSNTAEWQLVAAKNRVSEVRNENQTGGYALFNLRSSYTWGNARFDIGIDNVFNRFYGLPLGGAYIGQGKTMSANGIPWGVPVPGMGRSISTAFNLKF
ncbi:TonB-dependent receptor [Solimicrobium silvestre]|uniref:TonB dependent receptor n=1 Tax=Solimicrobium silvestre TaxID=2099400 RepID=A0A2S9GUM8_9BURK|nr:TonB-dependent receptor [Solimicrobium silvestre]PRC91356.1 TonB dependent receptor [Solimicrobium silvestre]